MKQVAVFIKPQRRRIAVLPDAGQVSDARKERLGHPETIHAKGVPNAHDAGAGHVRFARAEALKDRLAVIVGIEGNAAAGHGAGGEDIGPGGLPIHAAQAFAGGHIGHAQPHAAAVALRCNGADQEFFQIQHVMERVGEVAPDHVGVAACPADVFADLVNDEQVDVVKEELAHFFLGNGLECGVRFHKILGGAYLNVADIVVGILHHAHAEGQLSGGEELLSHLRKKLGETVKAEGVELGGASVIAQPDGHHFQQAAFMGSPKLRVGLHLVEDNDAVGLEGQLVAIERLAAYLPIGNHLHGGANGGAHGRLGDAVSRQQLHLSGGVGTAVASHGRHDEWLCTPALQSVADGLDHLRQSGNAPTAHRHGDTFACKLLGSRDAALQRLGQIPRRILDPRRIELLADGHHEGQLHLVQPLHGDMYLRKWNKHDLPPIDRFFIINY